MPTSEASVRRVDALFERYGSFHRNPVNKRIHWLCVPLIVGSVLGMLWAVSAAAACVAVAAAVAYYAWLSPRLAVAMFLVSAALLSIVATLGAYALRVSLAVFVVAWIGQFIGHIVEGRKPAFLEDVQSFLVAPAWLLANLLRRLGIGY